eukprot:gnl/TRDRNA2_/TRDRNA2_146474_c1_seq1.p1 gnl/TRDRNA2_/TRDRNA2_146474_c1~~gnl/TRDRNA2_/TRDRNA2_146474_c1_seq1.p1  ORF type:complete len:253 (-),score=52.91 gnl/TRDRNA2_/TRDRNA2_146474_c1_seq1:97-804(-)
MLAVESSERRLTVDFMLFGMAGHYDQCSQADATSATWDASGGSCCLLPNVKAELTLDGESLLSSAHYATVRPEGEGTPAGRVVKEDRLGERFGTETLKKLGGIAVLLQFLGLICADEAAKCYAEVLPFGLSAALLAIDEEESKADVPGKPAGGAGYAAASRPPVARPPASPRPKPSSTAAAKEATPPSAPRSAGTSTRPKPHSITSSTASSTAKRSPSGGPGRPPSTGGTGSGAG